MNTTNGQRANETMCAEDALKNARALLDRAKKLGAVRTGSFTLSSGKTSNLYFDGRLLSVDPKSVDIISQLFLNVMKRNELTFFGGPAVGAVPILGGLALLAHQRCTEFAGFFVRRESKQHGMDRQIEGLFEDGAVVAVYDDTISTGQSLLDALTTLQTRNVTFKIAMCILDRRQGGSDELEQRNIPLFNILVRQNDEIQVDEEKIREWFSSTSDEDQFVNQASDIQVSTFESSSKTDHNEEILVPA